MSSINGRMGQAVAAPAARPDCPTCEEHTMHCMEVWGGNDATRSAVAMPGVEIWAYAQPVHGDEQGGDIHYVSSCATGRITRLLVADVSGHGEAVARAARDLRDLMRRFVNYIDQDRFVTSLNDEFSEMETEGMFATAAAATFWGPTGRLTISNAGHPRPFLYEAKSGRWRVLRQESSDFGGRITNLPLGVMGRTSYESMEMEIEPGDMLLVYTDSLTESKDDAGRQLGEDGLLRIVSSLPLDDSAAFIQGVLYGVASHRGGAAADDDITLVALRRSDAAPRYRRSLMDWVRFAREMGWSAADAIRRRRRVFALPQMTLANVGGAFLDGLNRRVRARGRDRDGRGGD
ncbi:MAG: PP2C family protein-serine/threonine phosphatase [Planctomycetota bacterium]|nr:PP2C family protein-serine/threonine phosphatase [Planctomycetota bacterium]